MPKYLAKKALGAHAFRHAKKLNTLANWNNSPSYFYQRSKYPRPRRLFNGNRYSRYLGGYRNRFYVKRPLPITPYLKKSGDFLRGTGYRGFWARNRWQLAGWAAVSAYPYLSRYIQRYKRRYKNRNSR